MLLDRFLSNPVSVEEFRTTYLDRFKGEVRQLDEPLYQLLDGLFGDVDAFTTDSLLLADHPDFYLDENQLKKSSKRGGPTSGAKQIEMASVRDAAIRQQMVLSPFSVC